MILIFMIIRVDCMNLNGFTDLPGWAGGLINLPWWGYVVVGSFSPTSPSRP